MEGCHGRLFPIAAWLEVISSSERYQPVSVQSRQNSYISNAGFLESYTNLLCLPVLRPVNIEFNDTVECTNFISLPTYTKKYTFFPLVLLYFLFPALESSPGFIPQAELLFAQRDELREEDFGEILSYAGRNKTTQKNKERETSQFSRLHYWLYNQSLWLYLRSYK